MEKDDKTRLTGFFKLPSGRNVALIGIVGGGKACAGAYTHRMAGSEWHRRIQSFGYNWLFDEWLDLKHVKEVDC